MDDPELERFWVTARRHKLEEAPPEVHGRLLGLFATWAAEEQPVARPLRQFVAALVRDLGGTVAVAGARGGGGSRQLLHRWPDGDVAWTLQQPSPDVLRVVGQILANDGSAPQWRVSCVIDNVVVAGVDADTAGEFEFSVPAAPTVAIHLRSDEVAVVCGPTRTAS